ncbi:acetyl CoA synthetase [Candidatus Marsarchaeota G2 archaeon ECH_B_SAG-C16]|uniref:Acetyl CoA synthetase n=1 Tax=Candidatus Marsarchaeota G2 archaeon ECH_B_SAG-C16 TaxID=1978163 RepID=A0A2R6B3A3_9ARCH|nr:MAG: acetyl CoA synthetase [Candidatus Marsarchaeota G2 archaeon ECH_B_SAG-C16]
MSLDPLFNPSTIAVVGAAREKTKVGNIVLRNLLSSFTGKLYAVNPATESVEGVRSYRTLVDVPDKVDLAVVTIPRSVVLNVVDDAVKAGVSSAIVITSGFKELDEEGARLEDELGARARKAGLRVLGPNTLGLITPRFNATFSFSDVKLGGLALVTQSGGIGVYMLNWAHRTRTGLSYFVSLGNECDIKEAEVYSYLADDPQTKAIFSYNEGVSDGKAFLEKAPLVASKKPLVFLKGGTGKKGAEAVKTHTGSLAGSTELFRAAAETVGGIYVENLEEFLDLAKMVLSNEEVKPSILVVTNSGGHGVLTTDEIERQGLNLVELSEEVKQSLRGVLPPQSIPKNPLDLSGDADANRYKLALESVKDTDCTKVVVVQSLPTISCSELAKVLLEFKGKSVVGVVMGLDEEAAARTLESAGIPAYRYPEDAVRAIKHLLSRRTPLKKIRNPAPPPTVLSMVSGKSNLADAECFRLLEAYGLRTAKWSVVSTVSEASSAAERIGFPVVMKISTDSPTHKTELGGVRVNVQPGDVTRVFAELTKISGRVLVQEQLPGVEVFLGGIDDPVFGKAVVVGLGGIYVEVFRSVSYGLCPVEYGEAERMVRSSKVEALLKARNRNYSVDAVIDSIVKISKLMVDLDVEQLDINPLIVNQNGAYAVDVRIVLR